MNYLLKSWQDHKDSRGQGVRDSSDLLKNYEERSPGFKESSKMLKNYKERDHEFKGSRTLESLNPRTLFSLK